LSAELLTVPTTLNATIFTKMIMGLHPRDGKGYSMRETFAGVLAAGVFFIVMGLSSKDSFALRLGFSGLAILILFLITWQIKRKVNSS